MKLPQTKIFRLVDGTGLALQTGHRRSVDIDLFTDKDFDKDELIGILKYEFPAFSLNWRNEYGCTSQINSIKTDFFNWAIPFIKPPLTEDGLIIADKLEIGAMKLEAITTRKDKKDFIDIAVLLNDFSLVELLSAFRKRYPYINHKMALESLTAVDYADLSPEPELLMPITWSDVKNKIVSSVKNFLDEQKKLTEKQQQERLRKAEELLKNKKTDS
jgi:hypothetical protein